MICASIENLLRVKGVTPAIARQIRRIWRARDVDDLAAKAGEAHVAFVQAHGNGWWATGLRHRKRWIIDNIMPETYGVEYLGIYKRKSCETYYCNMGDTYDITVIFIGNHLQVGCWGDMVERGLIREREPLESGRPRVR